VNRSHVWRGVQVVTVAALLVAALWYAGVVELPWEGSHETATVRLVDENGTELATVDADVADTRKERIDGLSGYESLESGEGMLFVHGEAETQTYVMRGMSFPLDIVFVAPNGTVTKIVSAPAPGPNENGESITRSGYGKYVLEVPRGYADAVGLEVGDTVEIAFGESAGVANATATPTSRP
jgi:uncharacterized membrane protein (UPF0127 family)